MVMSKIEHLLRRRHLALLNVRLEDQARFEKGKSTLEAGRLRFELDWENCQEYWQLLKSKNPELQLLVDLMMERVFQAGILPDPKGYGASWHASNKEIVGRYEALLWCDLQLEGITKYLGEMRTFKERNLGVTMDARLKERRKKGGRTLKEWEIFQVKYRIHQHTKMTDFPSQIIEHLSPLVRVGWRYARYAVLLGQLTPFTEVDIGAMIRYQYWTNRKKNHLSPAIFSQRNYLVFGGWIKDLLEHLEPSLSTKQKMMVGEFLHQHKRW